MRRGVSCRLGWVLTLCGVALAPSGCGDHDRMGPSPAAASVAVASAIDTVLDAGHTAQLTATARDQSGTLVNAQFSWNTSTSSVVTVSPAGLVTAQGVGTATVTAAVTGSSSVSGTIRLKVVQADIPIVTALSGDAYGGGLVTGVSAARRPVIQTGWGKCSSGAATGNLASVVDCVAAVRGEAASVTDPTDRALLAVLVLYADEIERRLGL